MSIAQLESSPGFDTELSAFVPLKNATQQQQHSDEYRHL